MGSDSSDHPELARELEALRDDVTSFHDQITTLEDRVADLEAECSRKNERIDSLEAEHQQKDNKIADLEQRLTEFESRTTETNRAADAALKKADANKDRVRELQGRELEKGAHLRTETVDPHEIHITSDRLEKLTKNDGRLTKDDGRTYYRVPDSSDPLDRTDDVALAHGDLLPMQQLARMDADMRRSTANSLPTRLAAKLWQARTDPTIGDDPWTDGCKSVREYVTASDLKHWIRRQEDGISETYAKKLVSRTIDAILDLSKNRLAVRKRTQRKNGLEYTERRLILPTDAEIPGETTTPADSAATSDAAATSNSVATGNSAATSNTTTGDALENGSSTEAKAAANETTASGTAPGDS